MRLTRLPFSLLCVLSLCVDASGDPAQEAASRLDGQPPVSIEHRTVRCVVAERFPVIEARIAPFERITRARVFFRAAGTPSWYFVEMRPERGSYRGTLPRPMKTTTNIEYYIAAIDQSVAETRTADYTPQVVAGAGACPSNMLTAAFVASAKVAVGALTGGASSVPLGFSSVGILSGSVGGAAAGGAAASGTGGGISTGAVLGIVGGAGALAAGAALVVGRGDTWVGTANLSPADRRCTVEFALTLDLTQSGTALTGRIVSLTTTSNNGNRQLGCIEPPGTGVGNKPIMNGSVNGSSITFAVSIVGGAADNTFTFNGTRNDSLMEGTLSDEPGGTAQTPPRNGTWRVMRQ